MKAIPIPIKKHTKVRRPRSVNLIVCADPETNALYRASDSFYFPFVRTYGPIVHTGTTKGHLTHSEVWIRESEQQWKERIAFEILGKKLNKPSLWERIKRRLP